MLGNDDEGLDVGGRTGPAARYGSAGQAPRGTRYIARRGLDLCPDDVGLVAVDGVEARYLDVVVARLVEDGVGDGLVGVAAADRNALNRDPLDWDAPDVHVVENRVLKGRLLECGFLQGDVVNPDALDGYALDGYALQRRLDGAVHDQVVVAGEMAEVDRDGGAFGCQGAQRDLSRVVAVAVGGWLS